MKNNILDNFLKNELELQGYLEWNFSIDRKFSDKNKYLINYLAFSFLAIDEKKKLFNLISNSYISKEIEKELVIYFEKHFIDMKNKYPIKINLYKDFAFHFFNWVQVVNDKIDVKAIENITNRIGSKNKLFWLCLVRELHSRKLFQENLLLISKKKINFKNTSYYEDIILFEIYAIEGLPNYLYSKKYINDLCKLSSFLISYPTTKLFIELECSLLRNNKSKFESILIKNESLLIDFSILELLYIYEFSVLISSEFSVNLINSFLYKHDINSYENSNELYVYEFYNLLYKKEFYKALNYVARLNNTKYDFKHIIWYLKQFSNTSYLDAIKSIIYA
ncbi:hypothetical protein L5F41_05940 [Aliarcobacter butzleri]|uniref:hypothetical protein n=1 Tax=Aliarcobacter butzleri TaxID=28197 RepID=UPI001EDC09ED|nr:hypothetical protein [Aliarcobacter butzleri]MCG3701632.1 hypothetical protein [Aliarcobacter butzleri]